MMALLVSTVLAVSADASKLQVSEVRCPSFEMIELGERVSFQQRQRGEWKEEA